MNPQKFKLTLLIGLVTAVFILLSVTRESQSLQAVQTPSALSYAYWSETAVNTSQLIELGRLTTLEKAHGFAIQGDHAYIASGHEGFLKVVNIADPAYPYLVGQWQCEDVWICDTYGTSIWQVETSGNYAFVRGGGNIYVLDISTPAQPQLVNYLFLDDNAATPFVRYANQLYTHSRNIDATRRLEAVNISNPLNLGRTIWSNIDYPIADLVVQGEYMYVAADGMEGRFTIYDISQSPPLQLSQLTLNGLPYGIAIIDNYVYVGDLNAVHIIDVSSPTNPVIRGEIGNNEVGFVVDLHIENNVLYVSQKYDDLLAYSIVNRENPVLVASYDLQPDASTLHHVLTRDGYVYTTDGDNFYILAHIPPTTSIIPIPPPAAGQTFSIIWGDFRYGRTAFELQEQHNNSNWQTLYIGPNARYELSRQLPGEYCYRARLINGNINGDWSPSQCFTLTGAPITYLPIVVKPAVPPPTPTVTPTPGATPPPTTTPPPNPTATPDPNQFVQQVVALVNIERAAVGCNPVTIHTQLNQAALGHSQDMALNDFFSHTGSNGSTPWQRITASGYGSFSTAGENIAAGYSSPQEVMNGWMNSSGHRANILNCAFQHIGVGYYYLANDTGSVNYHHYWTQVFASP